MKKSNTLAAFILAALLISGSTSCTKEETERPMASIGEVTGELTFEGATIPFKSNNITFEKQGDTFTITAVNNSGPQSVSFRINRLDGVKTYQVNWPNGLSTLNKDNSKTTDAALSFTSDMKNASQQSGEGTVVVTALLDDNRIDNHIEGTITATAYNNSGKMAAFRQGKFSGSFVKIK